MKKSILLFLSLALSSGSYALHEQELSQSRWNAITYSFHQNDFPPFSNNEGLINQSIPASKINAITPVVPAKFPTSLSHFYDTNNDGVKEYYTRELKYLRKNIILQGVPVQAEGSHLPELGNYSSFILEDFNSDGVIDVLITDKDPSPLYHGHNNEFNLIEEVPSLAADLNNDGLIDFIDSRPIYTNSANTIENNRMHTLTQNYNKEYIPQWSYIFNSNMLDNSSVGEAGGHTGGQSVIAHDINTVINGFKNNWCIMPATSSPDMLPDRVQNIDFNKDGIPDLIHGKNKNLLLGLGNNSFMITDASGAFKTCDLNNDFVSDFIFSSGNSVKSMIYNPETGVYDEELLISNLALDNKVYCYDFDKDGDIDILLPFSNDKSNGGPYAFLAIAENDGTGKFLTNGRSLHENVYENKYTFAACADVNNDGFYDVVALNANKQPCLFIGGAGFSFTEPDKVLTDDRISSSSLSSPELYLLDIDNDNLYELIYNHGSAKIFKFEFTKPNQRPSAPKAPKAIFEKSTGMLKLSWEASSDAESSEAELSYALRIGKTPGGCEILNGHATPNGLRRNFFEGNMGFNLDKTFRTNNWGTGKFYIAVQAIDANLSGSHWSEETVVHIEQPNPGFEMSSTQFATGDTIRLLTDFPLHLPYEIHWELNGAIVIASNTDSTNIYAYWNAPGERTISMSITNGDYIRRVEKKISIRPCDFTYRDRNTNYYGELDIDGDGDLDGFDSKLGVIENDGKGNFTKIPKIYNADLKISGTTFADINMDGRPDICASTNKGNYMENTGNGNFKITTRSIFTGNENFNNDGYADNVHQQGNPSTPYQTFIEINQGDNINYSSTIIDGKYYPINWNNDGLTDLYKTWGETLTILINTGKEIQFQKIEYQHERLSSHGIRAFNDFNNDGYTDLLLSNGIILENIKDEYLHEAAKIDFPSDFKFWDLADIDNNGYLDIIGIGYIIYTYPEWKFNVQKSDDNSYRYYTDIFHDQNGDGKPDINYSILRTGIANEAPAVPLNLRVSQTQSHIVLEWDHATDDATPFVQMRYNVSLRKKGAMGPGSFILSPMNGLMNSACIVPDYPYLKTNRMEVPLSAVPEGEYELQIQAIDLWKYTSPMSNPLTFTVEQTPLIELEDKICAHVATIIKNNGNNGTWTPVWNWDGGEVISQEGNSYQILWNTPGTKNVTVTLGDKTSTIPVYVNQPLQFELNLPEYAFANSDILFKLPSTFNHPEVTAEWSYKAESDTYFSPLEVIRRGSTLEARTVIRRPGTYLVRLSVDNKTCNPYMVERTIIVKEELPVPNISLVSVDSETGKYKITWDAKYWNFKNGVIPDYVNEVIIYRQGLGYNDYSEVGRATVNDKSFIDPNSAPGLMTSSYRIALNTTLGIKGTPGATHVPAKLMLNKFGENSWNLSWNEYRGAIIDYYLVMRGTSTDNMTEIAKVSGNIFSYTDRNAPEENLFYAIAYERYANDWSQSESHKKQSRINSNKLTGMSNSLSTSEGMDISLATSIILRSKDDTWTMTPEKTILNLYTEILPVTATYRIVNWSIISGNELAEITQSGNVKVLGTGNGTIRVKAVTIDGSNIAVEKDITISGFSVCDPLEKPVIRQNGNTLETDAVEGCIYQWYKENIYIDGATDYYFTPVTNGDYSVQITNSCNEYEASDLYRFVLSSIENNKFDGFVVGPNPVSNELKIQSSGYQIDKIQLYDLNGMLLKELNANRAYAITINLSDCMSGTYILRIYSKDRSVIKKIIKTN